MSKEDKLQIFVKECIISMMQKRPSQKNQITNELELRFQDTTCQEYNRLLDWLKTLNWPRFYDETTDYHYTNNVRVTKWPKSSKEVIICKEVVRSSHLMEDNIKITWSTEQEIQANTYKVTNLTCPFLVRKKYRYSFVTQNLLIQLTRLVQESTSSITFEVEVEIWDETRAYTIQRLQYLLNRMKEIMIRPKSCQNPIKRKQIRYETPIPAFIGALPQTLNVEDLPRLQKEAFAVTLKLDGSRSMIHVDHEGAIVCYARDGSMQYSQINSTNIPWKYGVCLFDAEFDDKLNQFHLYDTIMFQGKDFREDNMMHLPSRLVKLQHFVEIQGDSSVFRVKHHWLHGHWTWDQVQDWARLFGGITAVANNLDGLIFTKQDAPYPKQSRTKDIFKWKPRHLQSIDFQIVKSSGPQHHNVVWTCLVQHSDRLAPFVHCPKIEVAKELSDKFENQSVVECIYQNDVQCFIPKRARLDKNKPNYITTAEDVWKSVNWPILPDMFTSDAMHSLPKWLPLRRAHGQVKRTLIQNTVEDIIDSKTIARDGEVASLRILDIACGRGGDLHSFKAFRDHISNYTGSDINQENINEAIHRFLKSQQQYASDFFLSDWRHPLSPQDLERDPFHLVLVQFAIHFFFESPTTWNHFITNVNCLTRKGAFLICTVFDAIEVLRLLKNESSLERYHTNGASYKICLRYKSNDAFGSRLEVGMFGDEQTLLKNLNVEYLVHMSDLIYLMQKNGWQLLASNLFNCSELDDCDFFSSFSRLNRSYVFRKM